MKNVVYTDYLSDDELDSTALAEAWYDEKNQQMFVKFQHGGNIAGYAGVSKYRWESFKAADSKGRYYSNYIKNVYRGIPGDVRLLAPVAPVQASNHLQPASLDTFKVTVSISGDLEFTVSAKDIAAALATVQHNLDSANATNYKVKKVEFA